MAPISCFLTDDESGFLKSDDSGAVCKCFEGCTTMMEVF